MKAFIPLASEFMSESDKIDLIIKYRPLLTNVGIVNQVDFYSSQTEIFFLILSGGTEQICLDYIKKNPNNKINLIAININNSLPASLEIMARLQQDNQDVKLYFVRDEQDISSFMDRKIDLSKERIGIIGEPSDWLIASVPDVELLEATGASYVEIDIDELYQSYEDVIGDANGDLLKNYEIVNSKVVEQDLIKSEAFYLALKNVAKKYELTALTVRCFDLLLKYHATGCFALGLLNDEDIVCGCEGDIVTLIGMIIAKRKFNAVSWMANPSEFDLEKGELILAHCTLPISMSDKIKLDTHFESGEGIGLIGELNSNDVTIFRLGGKNLEKKFVMTGTVIPVEHSPNLCRTQLKVKVDDKRLLGDMVTSPLGNHHLVVMGKYPNILD
jgi:L-fucose isomerase-like protein